MSLPLLRSAAYITIIEFRQAPAPGEPRNERGKTMNIARSLNNWRKYRQTVNELGRMSDRELRDLGIGREDIRRVARRAVAG